jgi:hypothetical protein
MRSSARGAAASAGFPLAAAAIIAPFRREFVYGLADASLLTMMQSHITRLMESEYKFGYPPIACPNSDLWWQPDCVLWQEDATVSCWQGS